jgi:hypothetical protein
LLASVLIFLFINFHRFLFLFVDVFKIKFFTINVYFRTYNSVVVLSPLSAVASERHLEVVRTRNSTLRIDRYFFTQHLTLTFLFLTHLTYQFVSNTKFNNDYFILNSSYLSIHLKHKRMANRNYFRRHLRPHAGARPTRSLHDQSQQKVAPTRSRSADSLRYPH